MVSFILGVQLQRTHALVFVKRLLHGRPLSVIPPSWTILDWDFKKRDATPPRYPLESLSFSELQAKRSLHVATITDLLRFSELPKDFPSKVRIRERVELSRVIREKIELEVEEGLWIPFYLFLPKGKEGSRPCILVLHGHSAGKIETAGIVPSYQRGNALALAQAGFVTVAPDFRGFGELGWIGEWEDPEGHLYGRSIHIQEVIENLQMGRTALGTFLYDLGKILNYLEKRPEIDMKRIGVAGTSMGADVAVWLAILDPRIKAVVASSGSLLEYPKHPYDYSQYHACLDTIPGFRKFFRFAEIPLLVAPRPFLLTIDWKRKEGIFIKPRLETLYQEAGSPDKLSFRFHSEGDTFRNEDAMEWFRRWL